MKFPVGLGGYIEGRGRDEREERAAEEIAAIKISILIIVFPGVFTLIHRKSVFLYVKKDRGDTGKVEMMGACFVMAAPGRNEIRGSCGREDPENNEF